MNDHSDPNSTLSPELLKKISQGLLDYTNSGQMNAETGTQEVRGGGQYQDASAMRTYMPLYRDSGGTGAGETYEPATELSGYRGYGYTPDMFQTGYDISGLNGTPYQDYDASGTQTGSGVWTGLKEDKIAKFLEIAIPIVLSMGGAGMAGAVAAAGEGAAIAGGTAAAGGVGSAGWGMGLDSMAGLGGGSGAAGEFGSILSKAALDGTTAFGANSLPGAFNLGGLEGLGGAGGVLSKAALDGTTAFGANSVPGAFQLSGLEGLGAPSSIFNAAKDSQLANETIAAAGGDPLAAYTSAGTGGVTESPISQFQNTSSTFNAAKDSQLANEGIQSGSGGFQDWTAANGTDALSNYTSAGNGGVTTNPVTSGGTGAEAAATTAKTAAESGLSTKSLLDAAKVVAGLVGGGGSSTDTGSTGSNASGYTPHEIEGNWSPWNFGAKATYRPGVDAIPEGYLGAGGVSSSPMLNNAATILGGAQTPYAPQNAPAGNLHAASGILGQLFNPQAQAPRFAAGGSVPCYACAGPCKGH